MSPAEKNKENKNILGLSFFITQEKDFSLDDNKVTSLLGFLKTEIWTIQKIFSKTEIPRPIAIDEAMLKEWFFFSNLFCFETLKKRIDNLKLNKQFKKRNFPYEKKISDLISWIPIVNDHYLKEGVLILSPFDKDKKDLGERQQEFWKKFVNEKSSEKQRELWEEYRDCAIARVIKKRYFKEKISIEERKTNFWESIELDDFWIQAENFLNYWTDLKERETKNQGVLLNKNYSYRVSESSADNSINNESFEIEKKTLEGEVVSPEETSKENINETIETFEGEIVSPEVEKTGTKTNNKEETSKEKVNEAIKRNKKILIKINKSVKKSPDNSKKVTVGLTIVIILLFFSIISIIFSLARDVKVKRKKDYLK